jgi:4-hydroxy-2-oxoglutarate aldolase
MARTLSGIIGPVVTPFDMETGDVAPVAFRANLRAHVAQGLAGVVIAGSTGEAALLDEDERRRLVEWGRDVVPDDRWLIVGAGAESTRQCIVRARDAAERGADAVLVVAPHYYGPAMTPEALVAHYRQVADASPIPVLLYNIPKYTHFVLEPGLVHELASHGNIVGIKDSSGDLKLLGSYLDAQRDGFAVFTGHAGSLYAALEMGVRGGILAVSLFAGALTTEICSAFATGDLARAGRAQEALKPLAKEIVAGLGVAGIKAAMDMVGLHGGAPRMPLLPLRPAQREQVAELLRAAGPARAA